jgi:hypothetical protein
MKELKSTGKTKNDVFFPIGFIAEEPVGTADE